VFGEATRHVGLNSVFGRVEILQVETKVLLTFAIPSTPDAAAQKGVGALTIGVCVTSCGGMDSKAVWELA